MFTTGAIPQLNLDLIQTLAIAGLIFLTGMLLNRKIPFLGRLNIPSAVLGGLVSLAQVFPTEVSKLSQKLAGSLDAFFNLPVCNRY
jgi:sodium--glutamate symport carrier gltS